MKAEALNYLIAASSDLPELPNESNERRERGTCLEIGLVFARNGKV